MFQTVFPVGMKPAPDRNWATHAAWFGRHASLDASVVVMVKAPAYYESESLSRCFLICCVAGGRGPLVPGCEHAVPHSGSDYVQYTRDRPVWKP